jgi:hypothetical protein
MKRIIFFLSAVVLTATGVAQKPSPELLNPTNHALLLIDHEGQMAFATHSISTTELRKNVGLVAGAS